MNYPQRGLNAADPADDDHDVAEIVVAEAAGNLLNDFLWRYFVLHVLSPHDWEIKTIHPFASEH